LCRIKAETASEAADAAAVEAMIEAAFWANLLRKEGYT